MNKDKEEIEGENEIARDIYEQQLINEEIERYTGIKTDTPVTSQTSIQLSSRQRAMIDEIANAQRGGKIHEFQPRKTKGSILQQEQEKLGIVCSFCRKNQKKWPVYEQGICKKHMRRLEQKLGYKPRLRVTWAGNAVLRDNALKKLGKKGKAHYEYRKVLVPSKYTVLERRQRRKAKLEKAKALQRDVDRRLELFENARKRESE